MGFAKPDKQPRWGTVPTTDPTSAAPNVAEPPDGVKDTGFAPYLLRPPRQWVNWLLNRLYQWTSYLADQSKDGFTEFDGGALATTYTLASVVGFPLRTNVSARDEWVAGERANDAAVNLDATDVAGGQRNYLYVDAADRTAKVTLVAATAFAAGNLPLGVILTDGAGGISARIPFPRRAPRDRERLVVGARGDFRPGFGLDPARAAIEYARALHLSGTVERVEIVVAGEIAVALAAGAALELDFPVTIRGLDGASLLHWSHDGPLFRIRPGGGGAGIKDLVVEYRGLAANAATAAVETVAADTVDHVAIRGCTVRTTTGLRWGIRKQGPGDGWIVEGNTFLGADATPIRRPVEFATASPNRGHRVVANRLRGNLVASAPGSESDAILFAGTVGVVEANVIEGHDRGVTLTGDRTIFSGNLIRDTLAEAIRGQAASLQIFGNAVSLCKGAAGVGVIDLSAAASFSVVSDNRVTDWTNGWGIRALAAGIVLRGNYLRVAGAATQSGGIFVDGGVGSAQAHVVANHLAAVPAMPAGSGIDMGASAPQATVAGNTVYGFGTAAAAGRGIRVRDQSVVQGNRIEACHGPAVEVGEAAASAVECAVTGNVVVDSTAAGSYALVELRGGRNVVTGNVFKGMTSSREAVRIGNAGLENLVHDNLDDNTVARLDETVVTALATRGARRRYAEGETSGGVTLLLLNTTLPDNEVVRLVAVVVARNTTDPAAHATWRLEKSYYRSGAVVTAIPGDTTSEHKTAGYTGAAPLITTAGAGAGAVVVSISGVGLQVIRWSAELEIRRARGAFAS